MALDSEVTAPLKNKHSLSNLVKEKCEKNEKGIYDTLEYSPKREMESSSKAGTWPKGCYGEKKLKHKKQREINGIVNL